VRDGGGQREEEKEEAEAFEDGLYHGRSLIVSLLSPILCLPHSLHSFLAAASARDKPALDRPDRASHPRACRRFILNCPPEDLQGGERILFQVETAWWFYEDNYREKDQSLQQFKLYGFADLSTAPPPPPRTRRPSSGLPG
jgi:hypothetical protein